MHQEPEDEYFLGGGDNGETGDNARNRRSALLGLAVVVVLVTVAITLTSLLVDTSPATLGPRRAAQQWGAAVVHGDAAARRRVECAKGSPTAAVHLTLAGASGVSTGDAQRLGDDRWSVPLDITSPDGSVQDSVTLTVRRESGRYVVC